MTNIKRRNKEIISTENVEKDTCNLGMRERKRDRKTEREEETA